MAIDKNLKIAMLPLDIAWFDRDKNLAAVSEALRRLEPDTDLLVLPELFTTGFSSDAKMLRDAAETITGHTVDTIKAWARHYNIAIAGSYLARTAHKVYNRGFFFEPSGDETFYDKHHLFSLSAESASMGHGFTTKPIIRFRGWNIALIVCYDLRFPVWCRNVANEYDVLLVPANWPTARGYAWKHLLIARAIENQAVVVGANRSGEDSYGIYDGLSFIFDPMGKPVGEKYSDSPFIYAILDKRSLEEWRERFPVSRDADRFCLNLEL